MSIRLVYLAIFLAVVLFWSSLIMGVVNGWL